jgi:hypothetical protein
LIDHYYSPRRQNSEIQSISRQQTSKIQPSLLPLQVTGTYLYASTLTSTLIFCPLLVLRAHNIPRLKTLLGEKKRFYATVTYGERKWQSRPVRGVANRVEWNENIDTLWEMSNFYSYVQTEYPAVSYNRTPLLQYLFMRKMP